MRWNAAAFAARGYVVVATDFHGSIGYGQKFKEQISGDWGGLAYDDVMRATDAAEKLPFVDPGHTCAAGAASAGTWWNWIAGHTDRFKCLVSHDGVFDLVSEYGSTEELWFPEWEFRGPPWENPELYRRLSPSSYVQNFKTRRWWSRASWTSAYPSSRAWECSPRCSGAGSNRGCSTSPTRGTGSSSRGTASSGTTRCSTGSTRTPAGK